MLASAGARQRTSSSMKARTGLRPPAWGARYTLACDASGFAMSNPHRSFPVLQAAHASAARDGYVVPEGVTERAKLDTVERGHLVL